MVRKPSLAWQNRHESCVCVCAFFFVRKAYPMLRIDHEFRIWDCYLCFICPNRHKLERKTHVYASLAKGVATRAFHVCTYLCLGWNVTKKSKCMQLY